MSSARLEMDHDEDGVGYVRESHYLKGDPYDRQQAMALLNVPSDRSRREGSISSNVSDLDIPIYSSENLTTSTRRPPHGVSFSIYHQIFKTTRCAICFFLVKKDTLFMR